MPPQATCALVLTGCALLCRFDELRALIQVDTKLDKAAFLSVVVDYIKKVQVVLPCVFKRSCWCRADVYFQ